MKKERYMYQIIKDYISELIQKECTYDDVKLPSENQLAMKFNVSRLTAKSAIDLLKEEGLVYRIHGKGTYAYGSKNRNAINSAHKRAAPCLLLPNFSSAFIAEIIDGVNDYFTGLEQTFSICYAKSQQSERECIEKAIASGATGFIVFPVSGDSHNKALVKLALESFPVVFVDRSLNGFDISCVSTDHITSAFDATKYMVSTGCRNIGFISYAPLSASSIQDRVTGYEKALTASGLSVSASYKLFVPEDKGCVEDIKYFLLKNPELDGILSCGDNIGLDLYRAAAQLNISVPDKLSYIVYDNEYTRFHDLLPYKPTVIAQQAYSLGFEAARSLHQLTADPGQTRQNIILPSKIILGGSTR